MSNPKRIYQIAKQINISHQEIIDFLRNEAGVEVANHMAPVEEEKYDLILKKFAGDLYQIEQDRKSEERRVVEDSRRREEEERIRRVAEEHKRKEDEERSRREAEGQRLREIADTQRRSGEIKAQAVADEKFKTQERERRKAEAEATVELEKEAVTEAEAAKDKKLKHPEQPPAEELTPPKKFEKKAGRVGTADDSEVPETSPVPQKETEAPIREKIVAKKVERKVKHIVRAKTDTKEKPGKKQKRQGPRFTQKEVDASIKKVMTSIDEKRRGRKKYSRGFHEEIAEDDVLRVSEFVSIHDFAELMGVDVADIIGKCMEIGLMVTINQRIDKDTIELLATEFDVKIEFEEELDEVLEEKKIVEDPAKLKPRPPVVTIMGHVDHGKTSLLDFIREANVIAGEAGGITQHIGAYAVELKGGQHITFLDTPGHEAFTAMRARGAQVTDIVVIVVAADDAVMPQTIEAIDHARAAGVPMIFAINKIDKPGADPEKVRRELAERDILVESWGGKFPDVEISAKQGTNVLYLLEVILLQAEIMELKANPEARSSGVVIESRLDKGLGAVGTVLIDRGTLHTGDAFVCGDYSGKVRALMNERGGRIKDAGPGTPVQILGFNDVPRAGDKFLVVENEKKAREISLERQQVKREQDFKRMRLQTLDEISRQIAEGKVKELNIVLKGDVDGSIEALADSFMKLSNAEVAVSIKHKGIGMIKESDVLLASTSSAVIIGFNVTSDSKARLLAKSERVEVRNYNIIYDAVEDIRKALEGMLEPERIEKIIGTAEILQLFKVPKLGNIAGSKITSGVAIRSAHVRVKRDDRVVFEGELASLKRFQDDAKEVMEGNECGIAVKGFDKLKVEDVLEFYTVEEQKRTLPV